METSKTLVDEAPAGPEMDAAVASALGLTVEWKQWTDGVQPVYLAGTYATRDDGWAEHEDWRRVLSYSTDIGAAWILWEWLAKQEPYSWALYSEGEDVSIEYYGDGYIGELEAGCGDWEIEGKAPLAICRAFLKVNGVEHIEVPE